jgi:hypothetical protein
MFLQVPVGADSDEMYQITRNARASARESPNLARPVQHGHYNHLAFLLGM